MKRIHCIPVGDKDLHAAQLTCWCFPAETEPNVVVHNAKDGRETKERITGKKVSAGWVLISEGYQGSGVLTVQASTATAVPTKTGEAVVNPEDVTEGLADAYGG